MRVLLIVPCRLLYQIDKEVERLHEFKLFSIVFLRFGNDWLGSRYSCLVSFFSLYLFIIMCNVLWCFCVFFFFLFIIFFQHKIFFHFVLLFIFSIICRGWDERTSITFSWYIIYLYDGDIIINEQSQFTWVFAELKTWQENFPFSYLIAQIFRKFV